MAMFDRTLDSRSMEMELEPEFSDGLSPHPIEPPPPPPGEEAGLWGCDDGEVGDAADVADGTEYSQLVGSPAEYPTTASAGDEEEVLASESTAAAGGGMAGEEAVQAGVVETEPPAGAAGLGGGKRKRGRPPKSQGGGRAQVGRPPVKRKEKEEEVVCFICFDGGSLVVCDRRGCPKVYHPACVNRDENFFHSRGRWNCGWHICSICQKSAHYMCYTCTYSLCKGCIREAEFVCIRGSKGFCGTCHRTTMLIESNEVGADFDDENSWEHLFKIYWLDLKQKLSLTREELSTAKNPWKGYGAVTRNENSSDESYNANDDQEASSDSSSERRVGSNSSKKKVRRRFRNAAADESSVKQVDNERVSTTEDTEWASKELLEFVAHMKDGGTPILSQFDVQALLLEYIKQNNLRDPRRKSQIICDSRLKNLFGKARVGHFEMLKLLESHFLLKEASQIVTDDNQEGIVDPDYSQMDAEGYSDAATKITFDKRRKSRKRVEEREPQTNLEDYAAIDIHNINLIYLRRNLMEDLIDDIDKFNEKVVGAFVRIRISGTGQRQDLYRLVQVVGTHTVAEKYKIGKKTTYITLEILNLKKLEVITIDTISNQEFTEEECKRLRQSIKCGLIHPLTVGEVQEKARVLQAVRVSDWLESEKLRLGHLRDRASEKGRRKELRECVEKLQILSTPEERRRRLNEIPEIHTDPNMDPRYESADEGESDGKDQDNYGRSRESFSLRKRREALSSGKGGAIPSNNWNEARRSSNAAWEMNRSPSGDGARDNVALLNTVGDRTNESSWTQGKDVRNSGWGPPSTTNTQAGGWDNNQTAAKPEQSYAVSPETVPVLQPTGISAPSNTSEADKIWHYLDPSGKVQGPFSMTQMRKWSTTGFFPPDLRIWRESERQDEAVLLTDALVGKFQKDPPQREPQHNSFPQPTSFPPSWVDNNQNRVVQWNAGASFPAADNTGLTNVGRLASQSTAWSAPRAELVNPMEGRIGLTGWETPRVPNAWPAQPQTYSAPRPTAPFPGNYYQPPPPYQGRGGRGGNAGRWNQGQDHGGAWNSNRPVGPRPGGPGYERQQPNWSSPGQQSSGEPWKPQPANESRNLWGNDSFNPPSPTPQPSSGGWANVQGAVNTSTSFHRAGPGLGTAPSTAATMEPNKAATNSVGGWGSSAASNAAANQKGKADGWGSWTAASSSMPDKAKKAEAVNGWDSWSAASASRPDKTKLAEPVDASTIPERSDSLVGSHTSSQQKEPSESDAPAILENQSTLPWEGMNGSACPAAMGGPTSKKNQFLQDDCPSPTPLSERQDLPIVQSNELDPLAAMEDKLISPATSTKPTAKSKSQGWGPASSQEQNGPSPGTTPSENREQNQNQKLDSCNWQGPPDTKSREWSLPSPTPSTKPFGWDLGADSAAGQNNPWASSDGSKSASSQPSNPGWGTAPQNPGRGTEAAQGNASTGWATTLQGNTNKGWGATTQMGTPAQPNANPSTGWGTPAQGSNASTGWGTPAQGNSNPNTGWGAPPPQGSTVPSAGWGAPAQVNAVNPSWGGPAPGNSNPNPGWGAPAPMGNTNANGGWGAGQGNPNNWGSQQDQNGEWFDRGGQGYRNSRTQSGGGGRSSSRPPPRGQGQRVGVCKFHESGYCKKGSSCNYLHS